VNRARIALTLFVTFVVIAASALAHAEEAPLLTGEVFSQQAQDILVPLTSRWRATISMMKEEGVKVQPGDVVVEFDGTEATNQLEQHREAARASNAVAERDIALLEKEVVQAKYTWELARVALELAELKASTPEGLIGGIEYAENQLTYDKAISAARNAQLLLADKERTLQERKQQQELDSLKADLTEKWLTEMLDAFRVSANQTGFVIYDSHPWTRAKYQIGDSVQPSFRIAQVADTSDLAIKVWINSVDRPWIQVGSAVKIILDAMPQKQFSGRLNSLSDGAAHRAEWGKGIYYEGIVTFDSGGVDNILPGMSALIIPTIDTEGY